jgi:alkylation response protein AidB-like acyl-CoA dehydrogenase
MGQDRARPRRRVLERRRRPRLVRLRIPEQYGGQGASLLDLGLLVEECGRAVAPFGIFASFAGSVALNMLGSAAQKRAWLPAIARGEKLVTLALDERDAARDPRAFKTTLARRGTRLRAERREDVRAAGRVGRRVPRRRARRQGLVARARAARHEGRDGRAGADAREGRQSVVRFKNVALDASALVGAPRTAWPRSRSSAARSRRCLCCDLVGGADAVLDMTVAYVCEREQFKVKLATFQAVQQMVAVMALEIEGARTSRTRRSGASGRAAGRSRGRDREGVDGARLPRRHDRRAPAPRRRRATSSSTSSTGTRSARRKRSCSSGRPRSGWTISPDGLKLAR